MMACYNDSPQYPIWGIIKRNKEASYDLSCYEIQEWLVCIFSNRAHSLRFSDRDSIAMAGIMQKFAEKENFTEI